MPKLIRITTAPISLNVLLPGQMRHMNENGFEVVMVSSDGPELPAVKAREGCRHHIIPMTRRMTPFGDLRCLWQMYKFFRKEKPDLVHSHTPKAGLLSMLAAKMAGVKLRVHTIAGLRYVTTRGLGRQVLIVMEKLTGMAATHVWPNSNSMRAFIETNRLVNPKKLEVIGWGSSNGVNLARYNTAVLKADKLDEIRAHILYDPSLFYFLSVGRIVHDKGMDELLQAFARLHKDHPHIRLVLVGAFEDEVDPVSDTARQLIKTHPAVISAGWSDAVEYYMHISQALVHPSHREGFPNVLMQAGAMSCPVICSRIDGNIDIVEHRKTGLIFEVKNEEALYREMAWALDHPAELKSYAQTLLQQVQTHYDQRIVQSLLREKYLQLLAAQ
ncbi:MAG: glycosyltransferase family 4 protein [Sphingobacteriales bacterium]|nr:glycosyltransferase family 4 protein [Sphingobacteriales bacterium]